LARYVSATATKNFQPVNITFALLPPLVEQQGRKVKRKRDRHALQVELALKEWESWIQDLERTSVAALAP
jgi:methylenetetrahydrofolate--tRNA-(uracil-5-)-methyltransferase